MYENGQEHGEVARYQLRPRQLPAARFRAPRWLVVGALALAFALTLGIGAALGSTILQTVQAASFTPASTSSTLSLAATPGIRGQPGAAAAPGQQGQCGALTVASVNGQTIIAKQPDGTAVTIHTTASTQYTKAGQSATSSAVTVGASIHVDGTHNTDGSITATHIDVR